MKLKILIPIAIGVLLVAATFIYSFGATRHAQREVNEGLLEACKYDNAAAAAYWLAKGAEVNTRSHQAGWTPLHECAHLGAVRGTQELLLLAGADVNAVDKFGRTPLHYTTDAEVARVLVRRGGDIGVKDKEGMTPLALRQREGWHLPDDLKAVLEGKDTGTIKFHDL